VIQEERSVLWDAIVPVIVKKKVRMIMCLILNGKRDRPVRFLARIINFLFSKAPQADSGVYPSSFLKGYRGCRGRSIKLVTHNHLVPKLSEWLCTCTASYVLMEWYLIKQNELIITNNNTETLQHF